MSEDRLMDLEVRYMHLERLFEELSKQLFEQQQRIDALSQQVLVLQAQNPEDGFDAPNEPPPHY